MSVNLESIQEMWEKDAKIDRDNLHEESLNIPSLHAKYFELYNTIFLLRKKAEQQRKNIRHERYEYFSGKSDPEVYVENPFGKNLRYQMKNQWHISGSSQVYPLSHKHRYMEPRRPIHRLPDCPVQPGSHTLKVSLIRSLGGPR